MTSENRAGILRSLVQLSRKPYVRDRYNKCAGLWWALQPREAVDAELARLAGETEVKP
jgi:hypothetical protein